MTDILASQGLSTRRAKTLAGEDAWQMDYQQIGRRNERRNTSTEARVWRNADCPEREDESTEGWNRKMR